MTPTHGWTRHGHAVHGRTSDHLPGVSSWQRFNKTIALRVSTAVGSMNCAWVFCLLAVVSLPATLVSFTIFAGIFPNWLVNPHLIQLVAWIAQTFIQLVLLSVIMVGQNIQSAASDVRATKTFEDTEELLKLMDAKTAGGLGDILAAIKTLPGAS